MRIDEITESPDKLDVEFITSHCGPYLAAIGGLSEALMRRALYRGLSYKIPDDQLISIVDVRQDRKPRDTPGDIHTQIDDWFAANLPSGIRYRSSSVFCSGREVIAHTYAVVGSKVAVVLPVGEFHYCWSPVVRDLYRRSTALGREVATVDEMMQLGKYVEDQNLPRAVDSGHEVMLHCQKVLLIRIDRANELYWSIE